MSRKHKRDMAYSDQHPIRPLSMLIRDWQLDQAVNRHFCRYCREIQLPDPLKTAPVSTSFYPLPGNLQDIGPLHRYPVLSRYLIDLKELQLPLPDLRQILLPAQSEKLKLILPRSSNFSP